MRLASSTFAALSALLLLLFAADCRFLVGATSLRGEVLRVAPAEPGQSQWRYDVRVSVGNGTKIVQCVGPSARRGTRGNIDTHLPIYPPGAVVDLLYDDGADPPARFARETWNRQFVLLFLAVFVAAVSIGFWRVAPAPQHGPRPSLARRVLGDVLRLLAAIALLALMVIIIFGALAILMGILRWEKLLPFAS